MFTLEKYEPDDSDFSWPFDRLTMSEPARDVLNRFWYQISQRRPFKHDFPDMYEKAPDAFDTMFSDIADYIDTVITEVLLGANHVDEEIDAVTDKIADRIYDRLIKGQFVDLKALIGVAARDGAEAVLRKQASQERK